jgi:hypothetical protein
LPDSRQASRVAQLRRALCGPMRPASGRVFTVLAGLVPDIYAVPPQPSAVGYSGAKTGFATAYDDRVAGRDKPGHDVLLKGYGGEYPSTNWRAGGPADVEIVDYH